MALFFGITSIMSHEQTVGICGASYNLPSSLGMMRTLPTKIVSQLTASISTSVTLTHTTEVLPTAHHTIGSGATVVVIILSIRALFRK